MSRRPESGVFLEQRSYRRRRLLDGLRLLPLLGVWLLMVPMLWSQSDTGAEDSIISMSSALIYIFCVWMGLIVLCAVMVWTQGRVPQRSEAGEPSAQGSEEAE